MKTPFFILLVFFFLNILCNSLHAQNKFHSITDIKSSGLVESGRLTTDIFGNTFFAMSTSRKTSIGLDTVFASNKTNLIVTKYSKSNQIKWRKKINGQGNVVARSITTDFDGNVIVSGAFTDTIDFDPSSNDSILIANNMSEYYISKYDSLGDFIWVYNVIASNSFDIMNVATDSSGNIYVVGEYKGPVFFNPLDSTNKQGSSGYIDGYILKISSIGGYLWHHAFTNGGLNTAISVAINGNELLIGGYFDNTLDFGFGSPQMLVSSSGLVAGFLASYNLSGVVNWVKKFEGSGYSSASVNEIGLDSLNNIYVLGDFSGTVDFDPSSGSNTLSTTPPNASIFALKLDVSDSLIWLSELKSSIVCSVTDAVFSSGGDIYMTGYIIDTLEIFGLNGVKKTLVSKGGTDPFYASLDNKGLLKDALSFGSVNFEYGLGITVNANNKVVGAGFYRDTLFLSSQSNPPYLVAKNNIDGYLMEFNFCSLSFFQDSVTACKKYVDSNGNVYYTSQIINDTIASYYGCDSAYTVVLTITNIDTSISKNGATLTANIPIAKYQWLDCDSGYSAIAGAKNKSFTPALNGNYAVEINSNGCVDTSSCFVVSNIGILDLQNSSLKYVVFPNPVDDVLNIKVEGSLYFQVAIFNLLGREVFRGATDKGEIKINMNNFSAGVYIVKIKNKYDNSLVRVIKQ